MAIYCSRVSMRTGPDLSFLPRFGPVRLFGACVSIEIPVQWWRVPGYNARGAGLYPSVPPRTPHLVPGLYPSVPCAPLPSSRYLAPAPCARSPVRESTCTGRAPADRWAQGVPLQELTPHRTWESHVSHYLQNFDKVEVLAR